MEAPQDLTYTETTRNIRVSVRPVYLDDESTPENDYYVWAYHVRIENLGKGAVRLRNRYWQVTDARGRVQDVRGVGVVGEQPILAPGEEFDYTSASPLTTPSGMMAGHYEMEGPSGELFLVAIPAFSLDSPHEYSAIH